MLKNRHKLESISYKMLTKNTVKYRENHSCYYHGYYQNLLNNKRYSRGSLRLTQSFLTNGFMHITIIIVRVAVLVSGVTMFSFRLQHKSPAEKYRGGFMLYLVCYRLEIIKGNILIVPQHLSRGMTYQFKFVFVRTLYTFHQRCERVTA